MEITPIWKILGGIALFSTIVFLGLTVPPTSGEKLQMAHDHIKKAYPICKVLGGTADSYVGRGGSPSVNLTIACGGKKTTIALRCGIFGCKEE